MLADGSGLVYETIYMGAHTITVRTRNTMGLAGSGRGEAHSQARRARCCARDTPLGTATLYLF